jgi:hypothetical protein
MSTPDGTAEIASWVFAAVALIYLAIIATYLIIRTRSDALPRPAAFILGFLCAIAGGFCAYFFSGKLGLNFKIPVVGIDGNAAGGFGVLVLVLLLWIRYAMAEVTGVATAPAQARSGSVSLDITPYVEPSHDPTERKDGPSRSFR